MIINQLLRWGGGGEAEHRDSIKNLQKCDAIKNNPTNTAQSLNTKQSSLRLIEQYKSSKIKDIIIKRGKQAYEIYLKIPLFCIPIINKYISYPVRLDLMYSAHGKWVGNFMQWSKIMLLIVLNEIDFKNFNITDIQRPDSTKDSYSESPIMFDDEFLHQE